MKTRGFICSSLPGFRGVGWSFSVQMEQTEFCGMFSELPSVSFIQLSSADLLSLLENQPAGSAKPGATRPFHHANWGRCFMCRHVLESSARPGARDRPAICWNLWT